MKLFEAEYYVDFINPVTYIANTRVVPSCGKTTIFRKANDGFFCFSAPSIFILTIHSNSIWLLS